MTTSVTPHLTVRIPVSRVSMPRRAMRACMAAMHLGCWLLAQAQPMPATALPADLRAALLAMPRQESPQQGVVVTVIDGETKRPLPDTNVFLVDPAKFEAVAPRLQRGGTDLDRDMLVMPYLAGDRYQTGADGRVVVPKLVVAAVYVVTATGSGVGSIGSPNRRNAAPTPDALEVRVETFRDYVVRAVTDKGQPAVGVPIEMGPYGDNGRDRFEPMMASLSDASGQVRFRMPGMFVQAFSGRKGTLAVQVSVLGGPPVRRIVGDGGPDGVLPLVLPPLGKVIVRLYDAQEHPRSGLKSVDLRAVKAEQRKVPFFPLPAADKPQALTADFARFDFVALGQKLVARVAGDGILGQLEHTQDGPTRAGELVVFAVRIVDSSPVLSLRLLGVNGEPVAKEVVSVRFEDDGAPWLWQDVTSGGDGRLLVALPEKRVGGGGRMFIWRRHEQFLADTIYGGAAVVAIPTAPSGLCDLGDVRLVEEPVAVAGRLVDSDGKPLAGCVVRMNPTCARDYGDFALPWSRDVRPERPVHHQATTDAEGRFTFRELEPAAKTGPLQVADGEWLLPPGTRLATGRAEQRLVATRPGVLQLSFVKRLPIDTKVELSTAQGSVQARAEADGRFGLVTRWRLPAARYDLTIRVGQEAARRIEGIEVRAGETCADPRLVDVDWTQGLRVITVCLRSPDGRRGGWMEWRCLGADERTITGGNSVEDGETLVLPEGTRQIAFGGRSYRTVVKEAVGDTVDVDVVVRRRIRLALAEGLELPMGLGVHAISPHAPDGRAAWTGNGAELQVDGEGACKIEIRNVTVDRGIQVVLWRGTLEVPATAEEPPTVVLPLDAAAIVALRDALAKAQTR